jgi:uncharacterized SAM-binding protein YcdF (DUF218 family)
VAVGLAFAFRAPLLAGAARLWIVDDAPAQADALAVLGGGAQFRTFAAARLYHAGVAPRIAFMDVGLGPEERERGQRVSGETRLLRDVLLSERVPEQNIALVGRGETSTAEEARALRDWAVKSGVKRLLIPTDYFHTRRVSWYFRNVFAGTGIETRVQAVAVGDYSPDNWWQHEDGVITFQNEVIKTALYLARR